MDVDLAELRRLAEAAREAPVVWSVATTSSATPGPYARFIAATGPDVVLALLDRLEAAEARVDRLDAIVRVFGAEEHGPLRLAASGEFLCLFCDGRAPEEGPMPPDDHAEGCAWAMARDYLDDPGAVAGEPDRPEGA